MKLPTRIRAPTPTPTTLVESHCFLLFLSLALSPSPTQLCPSIRLHNQTFSFPPLLSPSFFESNSIFTFALPPLACSLAIHHFSEKKNLLLANDEGGAKNNK